MFAPQASPNFAIFDVESAAGQPHFDRFDVWKIFAPQAAPNLTINDSSSRTIRKTAFLVAVLGSLPSSRALPKSKLCVTATVPSHLVDHQFGNQTDS